MFLLMFDGSEKQRNWLNTADVRNLFGGLKGCSFVADSCLISENISGNLTDHKGNYMVACGV